MWEYRRGSKHLLSDSDSVCQRAHRPAAPSAQRRAAAVRYFKQADPKLGRWITRCDPCPLEPNTEGTHFDHLVRSIVYQQLSGKAAATIHARYRALYGNEPHEAEYLLTLSDEQLRSAELTRGKMASIRDLAADQQLPIQVPRVRDRVAAREIPRTTYQPFQAPRALDVGRFRRVLGGRSCRDYEAAAEAVPAAFGLAKSSVSRRFVRASARALQRLMERRLDDRE